MQNLQKMIVVIDYGAGNQRSVLNMINYCGFDAIISSREEDLLKASKIILPGVGSFDKGMANLDKYNLIDSLTFKALKEKVPILGICLGMQLMCEGSEEGSLAGLGWIKAKAVKFKSGGQLKVPHMGWNKIKTKTETAIFDSLPTDARFYFVHSYFVECQDSDVIAATTNYGQEFTSSMVRENLFATQFHPEKSHKFGMHVMKNFLTLV